MTVSTTARKAGPFTGNGSTTVFSFTFKVFEHSDLAVVQADLLDVEETLVLDSDYSVSLNADQDANPGGTVTLTTALTSGYRLVIDSAVPYTQETDLTNMGGFYPETVNDAFDRATIQLQQMRAVIARSITLPVTADDGDFELPIPEANQVLAWNADADGIVNLDPDDLVQVAAYGSTVYQTFNGDGTTVSFTLSSSPGALGNLRVSISGVVQVAGADYTWTSGTTLTFTTAPPADTVIFVQYQQALGEAPDASDRPLLDGSNFSSVNAPAFIRSLGGPVTFKAAGITGVSSSADTTKMLQLISDERHVVVTPPSTDEYVFDTPLLLPSGYRLEGTDPAIVIMGAPDRAAHDPVVGNATIVPTWDRDLYAEDSPEDDRDSGYYLDNLTIDGDRDNNATQGEWGHCLYWRAAKNIWMGPNLTLRNTRGDPLCISYGYDLGVSDNPTAHCSDVYGYAKLIGAYRQGAGIIALKRFFLNLTTSGNDLYGCDLEADSDDQLLEDGIIILRSLGDGLAHGDVRDGNTMTGGGLACFGAGGRTAKNVQVFFKILDSEGYGATWREAEGLRLSGLIDGAAAGALIGGSGGSAASKVNLDVVVRNPVGVLSARGSGDRLTGRIVVDGADTGASGTVSLENQTKPQLHIEAPDGGLQQPVILTNTDGSRLTGRMTGFNQPALIRTGSTDNKIDLDLTGNGASASNKIIDEQDTSTGNTFKTTMASNETVTLVGSTSQVIVDPVPGAITTRGDVAATLTARGSTRRQLWNTPLTADRAVTLSTTGALKGDEFRITRGAGATGAFNLNIGTGPLKALASASTFAVVTFDGSAWVLVEAGTL